MLSKRGFALSDLAEALPVNKAYICGGGFCLYAAYYMYSFRPRNFPPGPTPLPFIGTVYKGEEKEMQEEELVEMGKKYGPVFSASKFTTEACVFVNDYEVYREEMKPLQKILVDRLPLRINDIFNANDGIAFSSGPHWVGTRRLGAEALKHFGMGKHTMYDSLWVEAGAMMEEMLKQYENTNRFNPRGFVQAAVLNVISSLCFGERMEYNDPRFRLIVEALEADTFLYDNLRLRLFTDWSWIFVYMPKWLLRMTPEFKTIMQFFDIVDQILAKREECVDRENPQSVVDVFIIEREKNPNSVFTKPMVLGATIVDIYGAGADTTQNTIRWSLLYMARDPDLQEELYQEALKQIGHKAKPKSDDLLKMPLFNAFLHEILRFISLVPQGVPHCPTESIKLAGYDIPPGTQIYLNQYAIHHDPRYWKYPNSFNVKNFLDDNGKFVASQQFMPFGWGKRLCLGSALARAEFFVFTLKILQEFKMSLPEKYTLRRVGNVLRRPSAQEIIFSRRD